MKKKIICVLLSCAMAVTPATAVFADIESDLREEQAWTSNQLDATYTAIDSLYSKKRKLQSEIEALDANLVNLMVSIESLKGDIKAKEKEIKHTKKQIKKAKTAKSKQYESMKKRIQYLYEKGGKDTWFQMMLASENLSDMLTKAEYSQKMYEYDRESLEKYSRVVKEIDKLKKKYETEKSELEAMKSEQEAESVNLQAALDERRAMSADCDNEIAYAQQLANDYAELIQQQQAEIERLEAERIAAEEASRAEAERIAYEQYMTQQDEHGNDGNYNEDDYSESYDGSGIYEDYYEDYNESSNENNDENYSDGYDKKYNESYNNSGNDYVYSGSGSGSSVVDYATQFVGNPYVWGGTSLTNGADCSGFVQSVYSNFGVSLPRTSYEQQNAGREVSYSEAQAGDLICYGGHVAIYMGDGKIVHASNAKDGIKVSDNAAYRTILSVRRLV